MKAIAITGFGTTDVLQIRDMPKPAPGPDEVLIKVSYFGINFADILARVGLYPDAPKVPFVPGYEVSGVVEEIGSDVSHISRGAPVIAFTPFGGYAEYVVAPAKAVVSLPNVSFLKEGAALPVVYATAYYSLIHMVNIRPGDRVLIQAAAGGVGLAAVQLAKMAGAEIFGTVGSVAKMDYLKKIGVQHPINYQAEDLGKRIMKLTQNEGVDIILDSLGGDFIPKGMKMLRAGGRFISIGVSSMTPEKKRNLVKVVWQVIRFPKLNTMKLLSDSKAFIGVNMKAISEQKPQLLAELLKRVLALWSEKKLTPIIDKVFPFDKIADAHQYVQGRKNIGKVLVEI